MTTARDTTGDEREPDWSRIPPELSFIVGPAQRYGHIEFEEEVEAFEATASPAQRAELRQLATRLWEERDSEDGHAVVAWIAANDFQGRPEVEQVIWLVTLLSKLGYC